MRKWISILSVVAILLGLAGCSSKGKIVVKNGEYYLVLNTNASQSSDKNSSNATELSPVVDFSSLSELKNDFETINFTENEFEMINKMVDDRGQVRIPDLSKLYEPVVPDDYSFNCITWYGLPYINFYYFYDKNTSESHWYCRAFPVTEYENELKKWEDLGSAEILSQELEEERNATVYHIKYEYKSINKIIVYSVIDGDKTIHVREEYVLSGTENVPFAVSLWVNDNGLCYTASVSKLMERPSVEWLSSFGAKEFVE